MKITGYVLTIVGTVIGGITFFDTLFSAETIPQQQAGVIIAIAWAVLPYIFARAIEKISEKPLGEILDKYFAPVIAPSAVNPGIGQTPRRNPLLRP